MYNFDAVFPKSNDSEITKVLALQEELSLHKKKMTDVPEAMITIKFPFAVQTAASEKTIFGVEDDEGCKIIRLELPALKKNYAQSETLINFSKSSNRT